MQTKWHLEAAFFMQILTKVRPAQFFASRSASAERNENHKSQPADGFEAAGRNARGRWGKIRWGFEICRFEICNFGLVVSI